MPGPFGLDCETEGIDPRAQSPVATGRIVWWSLGWTDRYGTVQCAFLYAHLLPVFREWLESAPVEGHNIWRFDRHMFAGAGVQLGNIVGDTLRKSQLSYSDNTIGHDLKSLEQRFAGVYDPATFQSLFSRPGRNKSKLYKTFRANKPTEARPWPVLTCPGEVSTFSLSDKRRELIPLSQVAADYPQRMPAAVQYAGQDAWAVRVISPQLDQRLERIPAREGKSNLDLYQDFWHPFCRVVSNMEARGVQLDTVWCNYVQRRSARDVADIDRALADCAPDVLWSSPQQLAAFLYDRLNCPLPPIKGTVKAIQRTEAGERTTAEASLHWLELNCPEHRAMLGLLRQRRKAARYGGYGRDLPGFVNATTGRLHSVMGPDTETGRLAMRKPALQQIPGSDPYAIRRAFVAAPGYRLLVYDFSQLEIYILAHVLIKLFGDRSIAEALASGDVYGAIAKQCWPEALAGIDAVDIKRHPDKAVQNWRKLAKIVVLATNYLKTPQGLAVGLLDETGESVGLDYANDLLNRYFATFPGVQEYHGWTRRYAEQHGGIYTIAGRYRPLRKSQSDWSGDRDRAARQAANTPIQGSAADIMAAAMIDIDADQQLTEAGLRQLMQVHDELVIEVPTDLADELAPQVAAHMVRQRFDLTLQLKVEGGPCDCWADGKD